MKINVNGTTYVLDGCAKSIRYECIVDLAGFDGCPAVTYKGALREGPLMSSQRVALEDGLSFIVQDS